MGQTSNWGAVASLIQAANAAFVEWDSVVKNLLARSDEKLAPLVDPLRLDLDRHRWLGSAREEAYSDWLAWILSQMTVRDLFNALSVPDGCVALQDTALLDRNPNVTREVIVERGHDEASGRLDLFVEIGKEVVLAIEIKKRDADDADTEKQRGYAESVRRKYPNMQRQLILVATGGQ